MVHRVGLGPGGSRWDSGRGLALEVIHGVVLGQQALALHVMAGGDALGCAASIIDAFAMPEPYCLVDGYQFICSVDGATGNPDSVGRGSLPSSGAIAVAGAGRILSASA